VTVRMLVIVVVVVVVMMLSGFRKLAAGFHVDLRGANTAAIYVINIEFGANIESTDALPQKFDRDAGVDECSEEHVPADAGEAFQVSNTHD